MYIRSQEKDILCECTEVWIEQDEDNCNCHQIVNDDWILGEYSTKEKALKALDMLEKHLEYLENKVGGRKIVFQMPQERDVF